MLHSNIVRLSHIFLLYEGSFSTEMYYIQDLSTFSSIKTFAGKKVLLFSMPSRQLLHTIITVVTCMCGHQVCRPGLLVCIASHTVAFQFCLFLVAGLSVPISQIVIPPPVPTLPTLTSTEPLSTKLISRPFILSRNSIPVPAKLVAKITLL